MNPAVQEELASLRRDGPRRFARWDATAFDSVAAGPARALATALEGEQDATVALVSYLRLAQQAAGIGVLTRTEDGNGPRGSLLERLLLDVVPRTLAGVPAGQRAAALAQVWNVGEGLLREPAWVGRYVDAAAGSIDSLDGLAGRVARTLTPILQPAPPAAWSGDLRVTVLDLRAIHDPFLPSRIGLAAPTVLSVDDRRGGPTIGVLLRRSGCEPLGLFAGLGDFPEPGPLPSVAFTDGQAKVGTRGVALPGLRRCHAFAVAAAGFVVACAVDSQRLWVIESD